MTRQELQEATGLPAEVLVDAVRDLVGRDEADLPMRFINNDFDKITIGPAWASRCEDMGEARVIAAIDARLSTRRQREKLAEYLK